MNRDYLYQISQRLALAYHWSYASLIGFMWVKLWKTLWDWLCDLVVYPYMTPVRTHAHMLYSLKSKFNIVLACWQLHHIFLCSYKNHFFLEKYLFKVQLAPTFRLLFNVINTHSPFFNINLNLSYRITIVTKKEGSISLLRITHKWLDAWTEAIQFTLVRK